MRYLESRFARFADRPALRREGADDGSELSYAELRAGIARTAATLRTAGVTAGTRVALLSENRPAWVIALLAALRAGATVVPLDPKLGVKELATLLGHAQPLLVLASQAHRERAAEAAPGVRIISLDEPPPPSGVGLPLERRASDDTALIIYTSGTTGDPKGVAITLGNLLHQVRAVDDAIGPQGRERFLSVLPLCHLYELICGLLVPLSRGALVIYPASETLLPAELARIMKRRRVTSIVGVPLLYRALLRGIEVQLQRASRAARLVVAAAGALAAAIPVAALRRVLHAPVLRAFGGSLHQLYSGGAALDVEVARGFERMGLRILLGYGLSETSPVIATNTPRAYRIGSVGRPLRGVEVRISPEGEIQTRGPHVMRGYVGRPDLTAAVLDADGWLRTGDLGHLDADGYLHVTGRAKDVIVLGGGKKVYPDEVEQVLAQHPAFAEVCVLGVAARRGNEEVCAVVVPAADDTLDAEAEVGRALASLAAFKRPTRVVVRREPIPRTTTRKAKRAELAAWLSAHREAA
ncbi:MAG TPA: AMP-binding protein [Kofleriaceae bacterium]|nr:AMP-binding protein [Kofleriaceae bacterium]